MNLAIDEILHIAKDIDDPDDLLFIVKKIYELLDQVKAKKYGRTWSYFNQFDTVDGYRYFGDEPIPMGWEELSQAVEKMKRKN